MKSIPWQKIFNMLSKVRDPFGEKKKYEEEIKLRNKLYQANRRIQAFQLALDSEQVQEKLEQEKKQVLRISKEIPQGDNLWFGVFLVLYVGEIACLGTVYYNLSPTLTEWWSSPENWYIQRYRPLAASTWSFLQLFVSFPYISIALIFPILLLWYTQRKLKPWHARNISRGGIFLVSSGVLCLGIMLFRLLQGPLIYTK